jgi:hypothetical protein
MALVIVLESAGLYCFRRKNVNLTEGGKKEAIL